MSGESMWPGTLLSFVEQSLMHRWRSIKVAIWKHVLVLFGLGFVIVALYRLRELLRGAQAIPRVNSKGCICGSVYRVASEHAFVSSTAAF
jgi:hypothetical protein